MDVAMGPRRNRHGNVGALGILNGLCGVESQWGHVGIDMETGCSPAVWVIGVSDRSQWGHVGIDMETKDYS